MHNRLPGREVVTELIGNQGWFDYWSRMVNIYCRRTIDHSEFGRGGLDPNICGRKEEAEQASVHRGQSTASFPGRVAASAVRCCHSSAPLTRLRKSFLPQTMWLFNSTMGREMLISHSVTRTVNILHSDHCEVYSGPSV